jgi:hypothetical protein
MSAVLLAAGAVQGVATAQPAYTDLDFYVANGTPYTLILARYKTGDPYPEYVKPDPVPVPSPDGPKFHKVGPGEKFTIGVRQDAGLTLIQIDFDALDGKGNRFGAGMVEIREWRVRDPTGRRHSVACWPSQDRSCDPRGWRDDSDTVVFTG